MMCTYIRSVFNVVERAQVRAEVVLGQVPRVRGARAAELAVLHDRRDDGLAGFARAGYVSFPMYL